MKKVGQILKYIGLYFISFVLISFAISKFLNVQFQIWNFEHYVPLNELPLFTHAWSFFGRSYNYNLFLGILEMTAGVFILFRKTRLAGLLLAAGIYLNVLIIDIEFEITDAILHASLEFIIVLLLLIPYAKDLKKFFWDMEGRFKANKDVQFKKATYFVPVVFVIVSSAAVTLLIKRALSAEDKFIGAYNVSYIIVNKDTLKINRGKYTKDPMLFFEFNNGFVLSTDNTTYFGKYTVSSDTITVHLSKRYNDVNQLKVVANNDFKMLKGTTNKKEEIAIYLNKKDTK